MNDQVPVQVAKWVRWYPVAVFACCMAAFTLIVWQARASEVYYSNTAVRTGAATNGGGGQIFVDAYSSAYDGFKPYEATYWMEADATTTCDISATFDDGTHPHVDSTILTGVEFTTTPAAITFHWNSSAYGIGSGTTYESDWNFAPTNCTNGDPKWSYSANAVSNTTAEGNATRDFRGTLTVIDTYPNCGNGYIEEDEQCDDSNATAGDGCSATCQIESGWECAGEPSVCHLSCGDSTLDAGEQCDDSNTVAGDGCSATCQIESGFQCWGMPSYCWYSSEGGGSIPEPQNIVVSPWAPPDGGWMFASDINAPTFTTAQDLYGYFMAHVNVPATAVHLTDTEAWQAELAPADSDTPLCTDTGSLMNLGDVNQGFIWSPFVAGCTGANALAEDTYYRWRARARYGDSNEYGPWSQWATFLAAADDMQGTNGQRWGSTIPQQVPNCSVFGGMFLAADPGDGMPCVFSWLQYLLVPTRDSWGSVLSVRDSLASKYPSKYLWDLIGSLKALVVTSASSCPTWLEFTGTGVFSDVSLNLCTWLSTLAGVLAATWWQACSVTAIGLATIFVLLGMLDRVTKP